MLRRRVRAAGNSNDRIKTAAAANSGRYGKTVDLVYGEEELIK